MIERVTVTGGAGATAHPVTDPAATTTPEPFCTSRRTLLRGLAALGVTTIGAGILTGCSDDTGDAGDASGGTATSTGAAPQATTTGDGGNAAAGVPTSQVPVGEARVVDLAGQRVVVAQPTEGEFVAFSSRCTHQGTTVEAVGGTRIRCPNHGSEFDGTTGAVTKGPAATDLPTFAISVADGQIVPA